MENAVPPFLLLVVLTDLNIPKLELLVTCEMTSPADYTEPAIPPNIWLMLSVPPEMSNEADEVQ